MMYVSNATLIHGRSHITTAGQKSAGVPLKTPEGEKFYEKKLKRFNDAVSNKANEFYRKFLEEELKEIDDDLTFFLEDDLMYKAHNMSNRDKEGWHYYNVLVDKHDVCKYFIWKLK